MLRRATLKDVAELAGVSTATVARVIHNNGYVADDTRQTVEAVLSSTGYQINALAQGLRRQRTHTIGHLLTTMIPNQFFATVAAGVEEVASANQTGVFIVNTDGKVDRERRGVEMLIQRRVDAILFTVAVHADNVELAMNAGIPTVQVERNRGLNSAHVTADNVGGARAAVEHLVDLGHRRIAIIGVDPASMPKEPGRAAIRSVEQERLSGYLLALQDAGIPVDESLVGLSHGYYYLGDGGHVDNPGYILTRQFLDLPDPPTAIFATLDMVAAGIYQALYERRLRVPDDVSVVGFDDTYSPYLSPPLTTVDNPMLEMGRTAARILFDHLDRRVEFANQQIELPMRLLVRLSTAPPPS